MPPAYVVEILRFGVIGLSFLLAFFAYRLLAAEQARPPGAPPRPRIIASIWAFMVFAGLLGGFGLVSEILHAQGRPILQSDDVMDDAGFWRAVFDSLPPSFIKRYSPGVVHEHLTDNVRLRRFQGVGGRGGVAPEFEELIKEDHRRGDLMAYNNGISFQLEYSDPGPGRSPQQIFTRKIRVDYQDEQYLVGMYVPVELGMELDNSYCMKINTFIPMLGLILGKRADECIQVRVGRALLEGTGSREGGAPTNDN